MRWSSLISSKVISLIHSSCVSVFAIMILLSLDFDILINPGPMEDLTLSTHETGIILIWDMMFKMTIYYLACDFLMMLIFPSKTDGPWILHHLVGGLGIYLFSTSKIMWLLGLYFELTELSSVFLNLTWILYKLKLVKTLEFKIFAIMLLLSYFIIRIIGGLAAWWYIYHHYDWLTSNASLFIQIYCFGGTGIIFCMNVMWFYKLIKKFAGKE